MTENASDGSLNFVEEIQSQARNGVVIVSGSFRKFAFSGREETVGHLARRWRKS